MTATAPRIVSTLAGQVLAAPVDAGNHALVLALIGMVAIVSGLLLMIVPARRRRGPGGR